VSRNCAEHQTATIQHFSRTKLSHPRLGLRIGKQREAAYMHCINVGARRARLTNRSAMKPEDAVTSHIVMKGIALISGSVICFAAYRNGSQLNSV
jgi:hypothetical protein